MNSPSFGGEDGKKDGYVAGSAGVRARGPERTRLVHNLVMASQQKMGRVSGAGTRRDGLYIKY